MTRLRKQLVIIEQEAINPHQVTEEVSLFLPDASVYAAQSSVPLGSLKLEDQFTIFEDDHTNFMDAAWFAANDEAHPGQLTSVGSGIELVNDPEDGVVIRVTPGVYAVQIGSSIISNGLPEDNVEPAFGWGVFTINIFINGPPPDYNEGFGNSQESLPLTRSNTFIGYQHTSNAIIRALEDNSEISAHVSIDNGVEGWVLSTPRFQVHRIG